MGKKKTPVPTTEQAEIMKKNGIEHPFVWVVIGDFEKSMLVKNTIDKSTRILEKCV